MSINRVCLHRLLSVLGGIAVIAAGSPRSIAGPPVLIDLGVTAIQVNPFIGRFPSVRMSRDGSTAVGATTDGRAYRWRLADGAVDLGDVPGGSEYGASQVSADGSVISGRLTSPSAAPGVFRWTEASGMQDIGLPLYGVAAFAGPMSADGSVLLPIVLYDGGVGGSTMWTAGAGYVTGTPLVNDVIFSAMNGDATVFATGVSDVAYLWTEAGGFENIGGLAGFPAFVTTPAAMTDDASVVIGYSERGIDQRHAWRWTRETGVQGLGTPGPEYGPTTPYEVSADGNAVVGVATYAFFEPAAVLWTPALGMVDLNDYLPSLGVDLTAWNLTTATGISADGTVISGIGVHEGQNAAWVISGIPGPGVPVVLGAAGLIAGRRQRRRSSPEDRSAPIFHAVSEAESASSMLTLMRPATTWPRPLLR